MSRIDEIRERCAAASPGPWSKKTNAHRECSGEKWGWVEGPSENWCWTDKRKRSQADADFIAHARTDIPALIAEVERLREERDEAIDDVRVLGELTVLPCLGCKFNKGGMPSNAERCGKCKGNRSGGVWRGLQEGLKSMFDMPIQ